MRGWDSVVGVATRYGLDGPGLEPRWGRDFPEPMETGPEVQPASVQWVSGLFARGKATTHPLIAPGSSMARAIALPPLSACLAYKGTAVTDSNKTQCPLRT